MYAMIQKQNLALSAYSDLYDIVVPADHVLRRVDRLVDFDELAKASEATYRADNGRPGYAPAMMYRMLFLKRHYDLSDRGLCERARTDLAMKLFLGLTPEAEVPDPSSLSRFRKSRMGDGELGRMIAASLKAASRAGVEMTGTEVVDSTHTEAHYNAKSARERVLGLAERARRAARAVSPGDCEGMPARPHEAKVSNYEAALGHCDELVAFIKGKPALMASPAVSEAVELLKETASDVREGQLGLTSADPDAAVGHKTADTAYFGYKTHTMMDRNGIITAAVVTSGEKPDAKQVSALVEMAESLGVEVGAIVGDGAYSESDLIEYAEGRGIKLVSRLKANIVNPRHARNGLEFTYNKDAGRFVCPAGHMAVGMSRARLGREGAKAEYEIHRFDVAKCAICPLREKCGYRGGASRTYSHKVAMAPVHERHQKRQETEEYRELASVRYSIEAKNGQMKNSHGFRELCYSGLRGMSIQAGMTILVVNLKRVLCLTGNKG